MNFTPHLMPMSRGILETIYVKLAPGKTAVDLKKHLEETYKNEPFVHVLEGYVPLHSFFFFYFPILINFFFPLLFLFFFDFFLFTYDIDKYFLFLFVLWLLLGSSIIFIFIEISLFLQISYHDQHYAFLSHSICFLFACLFVYLFGDWLICLFFYQLIYWFAC